MNSVFTLNPPEDETMRTVRSALALAMTVVVIGCQSLSSASVAVTPSPASVAAPAIDANRVEPGVSRTEARPNTGSIVAVDGKRKTTLILALVAAAVVVVVLVATVGQTHSAY